MHDELIESVDRARRAFGTYVDNLLRAYDKRCEERRMKGVKTVCFVGHGGAGKDTAAREFASVTDTAYVGSTSLIVNPLVAFSRNEGLSRCYSQRHQNRQYWYDWCREFTREDPSLLVRMNLANSDICVGIRADIELQFALEEECVDLIVWVNKVDSGVDPTMEFDAGRIVRLPEGIWDWVDNNKDLPFLRDEVRRVAESHNMLGAFDG